MNSQTIIVSASQEAACPKCSHAFPLSEGISRQTIDFFAEDFERTLARRGKELEAQIAIEAKRRAERESEKEVMALKEKVLESEALVKASKAQIEKVRAEAVVEASNKYEIALKAADDAVIAKESSLATFRKGELELRRQLRETEEKRQNQELDYQRKLDVERKSIENQARLRIGEEYRQLEAQYKTKIESAQREATELKRKLEQGSQQTQGEALELGLEVMLRNAFPHDDIDPVPKGVNGADLLHRVRAPSGQVFGTIVWEAKQTKAWQGSWLQKLKDDQQAVGADIAVLVSSAMPMDSKEPFLREADVWIARFDAARPLAEVLRNTLQEMHKLRQANTGRGEKMELVYNYICSPQFAQRVRSIVEGFSAMQKDLNAEKTAMTRIWNKREKQLSRMTNGMLGVVGDLQGIAHDSLPQLESVAILPFAEDGDATESEDDVL